MADPATWETLSQTASEKTERLAVDGGFLYRTIAVNGTIALAFGAGAAAPVGTATSRKKADEDDEPKRDKK